ncbi:unnamed protein product [Caenorhabditis auriculariae]|uniref:Uncharacterized protein n=1 Tax=Caenorhabditis auriculariae TaxID=2777116 RepID=A0A8S1GRS1_9PELO|nr:unnamed protein product [Caenorhabditis auriculariae]
MACLRYLLTCASAQRVEDNHIKLKTFFFGNPQRFLGPYSHSAAQNNTTDGVALDGQLSKTFLTAAACLSLIFDQAVCTVCACSWGGFLVQLFLQVGLAA